MRLPFTVEQFYDVFREYNEALWPAPLFLTALALVTVALVLAPRPGSGVAVSAALAVLWAWLGVAYHLAFFTAINPLAYAFAALSLAGAVVFVWQGVVRRHLAFGPGRDGRSLTGGTLIAFALVGTQAAFLLGVPQDLGLGVAGVVGVVLVARAR